jgi:hypothetical protein
VDRIGAHLIDGHGSRQPMPHRVLPPSSLPGRDRRMTTCPPRTDIQIMKGHRSMRRTSPLGRLSQRVHRAPPRGGLTGLVQRVAVVLLPPPAPPPPAAPLRRAAELLLTEPSPEQSAARERARRALLDARRTMSGLIGEEPAPSPAEEASLAPVTPDLDRLQAYLEESERERAALKEELVSLREIVSLLQSRLDGLERALPPGPAAAGTNGAEPLPVEDVSAIEAEEVAGRDGRPEAAAGSGVAPAKEHGGEGDEQAPVADAAPTEPDVDEARVRELRERVLRALRERVFAAGTVGTRVRLAPAPSESAFVEMVGRFNEDPSVEHAEPLQPGEDDAAQVRVTLRAPLRWEQFGALLERALGVPIDQHDVHWSQGAVQVRLPGDQDAEPTPAPDSVEPCA